MNVQRYIILIDMVERKHAENVICNEQNCAGYTSISDENIDEYFRINFNDRSVNICHLMHFSF